MQARVTQPLAIARFERAIYLALGIALLDGSALVVGLLAAAHPDLDLHTPFGVEVHRQGDERVALAVRLLLELDNLLFVQQQTPAALRIHIEDAAVAVRRNVHAVEPCLAPADHDEAVAQLRRVLAQRADLGPGQLDARLDAVFHEVVVKRLSVLGYVGLFGLHRVLFTCCFSH